MEILNAEEIIKEILEQYNKRPVGWRIASDYRGNSIFIGHGKGYMIKTMMVSPQENLGVGVALEDAERLEGALGPSAPSGFRPMGTDLAQMVLNELSRKSMEKEMDQLINRILSIEPVPTWELQNEGVGGIVGGPYLAHPDLRMISRSQSELDERLRRELQNLFLAKHPLRASMFR